MNKEDLEAVKLALVLLKKRIVTKHSMTERSICGLRKLIQKYTTS